MEKIAKYKKYGAERHAQNPFYTPEDARRMATSSVRGVVKKNARGVTTVESATGIVLGEDEMVFAEQIEVDSARFIKLYAGSMKEFLSLDESARKVLEILVEEVEKHPNQDTVMLLHELHGVGKISDRTFRAGVSNLIKNNVIARHVAGGMFFINPKLMFNGNRMRFMREVVRKKDLDKNLSLFSSNSD